MLDSSVQPCSGMMRTHWCESTAYGLCGTSVKAMNLYRSPSVVSELAALLTAQTCSRLACSLSLMDKLASPLWLIARLDAVRSQDLSGTLNNWAGV